VLPENRPGEAHLRAADDHPVDMAADATARGLEAELAAVARLGAQIEPGQPQPADGEILEDMAGGEDAQAPPLELLAGIGRRVGHLVDEAARAGLADPAGAEIVAGPLASALGHEGVVEQRVDPGAERRGRVHGAAVDEARAVVEIDQHPRPSQNGISPASDWRCIEAWKPSTQASITRSMSSAGRSKKGAISPISVSASASSRRASRIARVFHVGLVDHAVVPLGVGRARREAGHRAEAVMRGEARWPQASGRSGGSIAATNGPAQAVAVAEAPGLPAAERAGHAAAEIGARHPMSKRSSASRSSSSGASGAALGGQHDEAADRVASAMHFEIAPGQAGDGAVEPPPRLEPAPHRKGRLRW
jgi:hypothetical protein